MANNNNVQVAETSFVNLFPEILYDGGQEGQKSLDIWNSYRVIVSPTQFSERAYVNYLVQSVDTIPSIAYAFYGTTSLWWLIPLVNDTEDPFDFLANVIDHTEGEQGTIKLLKREYIGDILFTLKRIKANTDNNGG